ncbi:MAG: cupin domain-containing protein [Terracidiphilus sp.]|jgi:mannose-6-phosphate isomerase-like protein (cupin superfamily)
MPDDQQGPTAVVSRNTAEHYTWGGVCDGWYLLRADDLSVIEERMPPASSETRHHHRLSTQFFYVLAGVLSIEVEDHQYTLQTGEGIEVHPGQMHQARNVGHSDLRMLVVSHPPSHDDRVND